MAETSWINKIRYQNGEEGNTTFNDFFIGTTFDKVYSDANEKTFSLANLAEALKNFFNRPAFMIYSTKIPDNDSKIVEFYSITGDTNRIDSHFNNKS